MWQLEAAQDAGWEVYAYSEYGSDGIPKNAEIRKEIAEEDNEFFSNYTEKI